MFFSRVTSSGTTTVPPQILYPVMISLILLCVVAFVLIRKRNKNTKEIFTIQNISLFAVFTAVAVGLSFWNITIIPHTLSLSFDTIPIMLLGFLLGPAEGFVFGFFVDCIFTLIKGWQWLFIYALTKPFIGFIAGLVGSQKDTLKKDENQKYLIMFSQIFMALLFILSMVLINVQDTFGNDGFWYDGHYSLIMIDHDTRLAFNIALPITFALFEAIYLSIYKVTSKETFKDLNLSLLIVIIIAIITSFGFNSFAAQVYYGVPYQLSALSRVFTNPIFLPIQTYLLFTLINTSKYASHILTNSQDKW